MRIESQSHILRFEGTGSECGIYGGQRLAEGLRGEIATGPRDGEAVQHISAAEMSRGAAAFAGESPVWRRKMTMAQAACGTGSLACGVLEHVPIWSWERATFPASRM